jgi:hypothetical protein
VTAIAKFRLALLCLATFCAVQPVVAQGDGVQIGGGGVAEGFAFQTPGAVGMQSIALYTAPFAARYTGPFIVELSGAYAFGTLLDTDGKRSSISGLTDTSLRMALPLAGEHITLATTVYLPTGNATQTLQEATVAGVIAADLLPFRITNWGSGGGFDASATLAFPVGGFGVGARFGYSAAREFEPLENGPTVFSYQPGDLKYVRIALDRTIGASAKASVSASMQQFDDDAFNGANLYRSGDRWEILGSLDLAAGDRASASLYGGLLHRSRSAFLNGTGQIADQDLIVAGAGLRIPLERALYLPSADLRIFRSADGLGQGYMVGLGTAMEFPFRSALLIPTMRGRIGRIVVNDQNRSGFIGAEAGFALRFLRRR